MIRMKVLVVFQVANGCDYCDFLQRRVEYWTWEKCRENTDAIGADLIILECTEDEDACIAMIRHLKQSNPRIPIIIVSGFGSEDFVINAFRSGARDLFKNPVNGKELRKTVDTILWLRQESLEKRNALSLVNVYDSREKERLPDDVPANIVRSLVYIENNLLGRLNLDAVAGEACMSKFHFCRVFKKFVGITPIQYTVNMRLKRAMSLLQRRDLSITAIAAKSGFNDLSQFNRQFKRLYGSSPATFRKIIVNNNGD